MRPLLTLLLLLPAAAQAEAPKLDALADWQSGQWQASMVGGRTARAICLADPEALLAGGRPRPGCTYSIIENTGTNATVTYKCPAGRTGRTTLRRDAQNIYTVDAQGIDSNLPFGDRSEWRRTGAC
jgi:hypothetical protein